MRPLFLDGFAGGGGASTGIAQALGRDVDAAINHNEAALAIHAANHPGTEHHRCDIRTPFLPRTVTRGRRVGGAWFSPDCKEFSKAKGGSVKERHIRMLAMEIPHWLEETKPEVAYVENVEEFADWGPLEQGEDGKWRVILNRKGEDFKKWLGLCRRQGYRVAYRELRACDYGAPTSRKRLYIVMRRDKKPIVWPKPTHGRPDSVAVRRGKLLPYRTAAECIDWSIPCPSIFDRARPLKDATLRRIAHGVMRYVVNAQRPFVVGTAFTNTRASRVFDPGDPLRTTTAQNEFGVVDAEIAPFVSYGQHGGANRPADEPHHTIAASKKDTNGVVQVQLAPHITKFHSNSVGSPMDKEMPTVTANGNPARPAGAMPLGMVGATLYRARNGEREGQAPRALDVEKPLGVVAAESSGFGLATAELAYLDRQFGNSLGSAADEPAPATTAGGGGKTAAVTAFMSRYYGSDKTGAGGDMDGQIPVVRAGGQHHAVVCAHIEQANGGPRNTNSAGRDARRPLSTATTTGSQQRIVETTLIEEGALPPEMMARAVQTAAFLVKYYGTGGENEVSQIQAANDTLDTITTRARFAVVTVTIDAVTYVIVDIGLRMLKPRELARAQGFPEDYVLDPIVPKMVRGKLVHKRLTIAEQISAIGNSVCPPVARALVAANQPEMAEERLAA